MLSKQKTRKVLSLLPLLFLFSCASRLPVKEGEKASSAADLPQYGYSADSYLTIVATGDNLYHMMMINEGEDGDYEKAYLEIRQLVKAADIAFINQETLLGGKDFSLSGYPLFNSPQKVGHAVSLSGFNVVNHATNHSMDKGEKAILATLDFWDTVPGVTVLGIHRSEEMRSLPVIVEKNKITVGFLSYTYGTNSIPLPRDKPFLVSLINTEMIAKEIDALRPLCDFLVVSMHWGEEYHHDYNESQKNLAALLAEHGVDLVIGHHPHVIQPIEYIERPDGNNMVCYFSLGNLISAQTRIPTMLGAMAFVRVTKKSDGGISITEAKAIPLVTHYEKGYTGFKIFPLYSYTDELAERHFLNQQRNALTLSYLKNLSAKIFGDRELKDNPY